MFFKILALRDISRKHQMSFSERGEVYQGTFPFEMSHRMAILLLSSHEAIV